MQGVPVTGAPAPVEGSVFLEERGSLGLVLTLQDAKGANILTPIIGTSLVAFSGDGTVILSGYEAAEEVPTGMGPLYLQQWKVLSLAMGPKQGPNGVSVEAVMDVEG